jgi:hypothetical protein
MQFLNALAEAALSSPAAGTDVVKALFISRVLRELGVTLWVGIELVYRGKIACLCCCGWYARADGHECAYPTTDVT